MKTKILSGLLLGCLMTGLTACHDDLNVVQPSQFTSRSMWTVENDAKAAVNGMFNQFRSIMSENFLIYGDMRSNLYKSGSEVNDNFFNRLGQNSILIGDSPTNWASFYTTINSANLVLKHVPDIKFQEESTRNEVLANAYFVRAFCYYTIARVWGDAPLLITGFESENQEDMYPTRTPVAEIYAQIESDLDNAISLMPTARSIHKASKGSINMLRADFFLWKAARLGGGQAYYQKALDAANAVIGGGYSLLANFKDVFKLDNESNDELIFTFPYTVGENVSPGGYPNYYSYFLAPVSKVANLASMGFSQEQIPGGSHAQYVVPTPEYLAFLLADPADTRSAVTVLDVPQEVKEILIDPMFVKFQGQYQNGTRIFDNDMIIYRLAEAYLLKAEACSGLGDAAGAMAALNVIAKRARGVDNYYTGLSGDALTDAIIDESKMELAAEGKMFWLYMRMNQEFKKISSLVGKENVLNITLWPVAQACINTNSKIEQTPGYK